MILQDKIKSRGKADACRGFLTKYCGIRSGLERINPYGSPPLDLRERQDAPLQLYLFTISFIFIYNQVTHCSKAAAMI